MKNERARTLVEKEIPLPVESSKSSNSTTGNKTYALPNVVPQISKNYN
jgi:hypothetical protein